LCQCKGGGTLPLPGDFFETETNVVKRRREPAPWEKAMALRLVELRRARGLTQEKLARAAGITVDAVRKWEAAKRSPSFEMAIRLANALDIGLDELAGRESPRPARTPKGGK
jgi:DNA-binding XRE family transcriptional regulator